MNYKQRILATIEGAPVDHLAFVPRWDLWFNGAVANHLLPPKYAGWHIFDVARDLGFGVMANRGFVYRKEILGVKISEAWEGDSLVTRYSTPFGDLQSRAVLASELSSQGVQRPILVDYPVKGHSDYDAACFIAEHTHIVPNYDEYLEYEDSVGDDGVVLAWTRNCPAHHLMKEFTGYERFYYDLWDYPQRVEMLLSELTRVGEELQDVAVNSPATIIQHGSNFDGQLTPPDIYREYFMPFFKQFANKLHASGKYFATHADGNSRGLLGLLKDSGYDIIEAFTPAPMTPVTLEEAVGVWGTDVVIWGGFPTVIFTDYFPEEKFIDFVDHAIKIAAENGRFILGTADNVPTDGLLERVLYIRDRAHEACPEQ